MTSDIRWRFTRRNLHELRHHAHPIALGRGFAAKLVADRWPGLTYSEAMAIVGRAGVWCKDPKHFAGLGVAEHVKEVQVMEDGTTLVIEFTDEELATRVGDPDRLTWGGPRRPST